MGSKIFVFDSMYKLVNLSKQNDKFRHLSLLLDGTYVGDYVEEMFQLARDIFNRCW